jgi:probable HAF family extracellular repeat protein
VTVSAWSAPYYLIQSIGPVGYESQATGINDAGMVVGNYELPDGTYRTFVWRNGVVTTLGTPPEAISSRGTAINANGQVAGYIGTAAGARVALWSNLPSPVILGNGYAMAINDAGEVAGMRIAPDGSGAAFVTHNGVETSLGQPAGGDWSTANDLNGAGGVSGTAMNANGHMQAYSIINGMTALLGGAGGANSYANAINGAGIVAGAAQRADGAMRAVIWNGIAPTLLGSLGGTNSYAYGINGSGTVVGYGDLAGGGTAAFVYDNGALYDLNLRITGNSGWQLLDAMAINASGQIVGRGLFDGVEQAYLLTPMTPLAASDAVEPVNLPEPRTLLLMGAALMSLYVLRGSPKH